ncbi:MAG: hypothetical protein HRU19_23995 [Pseudobacteriovorax sp.]|nr:hypothetical protein [Pseudobacteriovorax sp.]
MNCQQPLVKNLPRTGPSCLSFDVQITQITRILKKYEERGWTEKADQKSAGFTFKPEPLLKLLGSLADHDEILPVKQILFLQAYLDSYHRVIRSVLAERGLDLNSEASQKNLMVFEKGHLFRKQIQLLKQGVADIKERILDSEKLIEFISDHKDTPQKALTSLSSEYSYRLSHMRSFKEWLEHLPPAFLEHEFQAGFELRHERFYQSSLAFLNSQIAFYENQLSLYPSP